MELPFFNRSGLHPHICKRIFDRVSVLPLQTRMAVSIIAGATLLRLGLLLLGWPPMDSDQGTIGIAAIHIFQGTDFPIFFYGQSYMGTLEAYLAAGFFHLFGLSAFSLRAGLLLFYIGFLVNSFFITRKLFSATFAIFILILEGLGSNDLVFREINAQGGYPEFFFFVTLLWLIALELVLPAASLVGRHRLWKRFSLYGLFALVAGFSIYNDPLILPFVFFTTIIVLLYCSKEIFRPLQLCISTLFFFGLLPWLLYLLEYSRTPILTALNLSSIGHFTLSLIQVGQTLLISIPIQLSGNGLCPTPVIDGLNPGTYPAWASGVASNIYSPTIMKIDGLGLRFYPAWAYGVTSTNYSPTIMSRLGVYGVPALSTGMASGPYSPSYINPCLGIHAGYGVLVTGLFLVTLCTLCVRLLSLICHRKLFSQASKKTALQLMPVLSIFVITLVFMSNTVSAFYNPWSSSRYLVGFTFSLPSMLWIPWSDLSKQKQAFFALFRILKATLLGFIAFTYIAGFIAILFQISGEIAIQQQQLQMIQLFKQNHISHIYTDYWTCDRIAFQSQERVTCMVLWYNLKQGENNYTPYIAPVQRDPHAAYVFPVGSPQSSLLLQDAQFLQNGYIHTVLDGYDVFFLPP